MFDDQSGAEARTVTPLPAVSVEVSSLGTPGRLGVFKSKSAFSPVRPGALLPSPPRPEKVSPPQTVPVTMVLSAPPSENELDRHACAKAARFLDGTYCRPKSTVRASVPPGLDESSDNEVGDFLGCFSRKLTLPPKLNTAIKSPDGASSLLLSPLGSGGGGAVSAVSKRSRSRASPAASGLCSPFVVFSCITPVELKKRRDKFKISVTMDAGKPVFLITGRPDNQSGVPVQRKIKERLHRLVSAGMVLTDVQVNFMERAVDDFALLTRDIHIAHNIGIKEMSDAIIRQMNKRTPISAEEEDAAYGFAEAIASTDDEVTDKAPNIKKKLPDLIKRARNMQEAGCTEPEAIALAEEAESLLRLLNQRSKNLMPGHGRVNSAIAQRRDPHLTKNPEGIYRETDISQRLFESAMLFFERPYDPVKSGVRVQSSSVDSENDPAQAYYMVGK